METLETEESSCVGGLRRVFVYQYSSGRGEGEGEGGGGMEDRSCNDGSGNTGSHLPQITSNQLGGNELLG